MPAFEEGLFEVIFERGEEGWHALEGEKAHLPDTWEADYRTMVLSLGDYMRKAGFGKAVLGLSGGGRLGPCRRHRLRCAGAGERALRDAALALHLRGIVDGRASPWRSGWDAGSTPYPLAAHMSP